MKDKPQIKVSLDESSNEYQTVAKKFRERSGQHTIKIIGIDKIQNIYLRDAYLARKSDMEAKHSTQEKILYHATDHDGSLDIERHGFRRKSNAATESQYGEGMYFTEKPWHQRPSLRPLPDRNGHQFVYQARVLLGQSAHGRQGMTAPPPRSRKNPEDLFHSLVDYPSSPSTFVIFQGNQAYPEYLITFE